LLSFEGGIMNKPLLAAGALLLVGIGSAGAGYVASSGGEEEVVQQVETSSPSPQASATLEGTRTPTPSPIATRLATRTPVPLPSMLPIDVPSDWAVFTDDRVSEIIFRYPPNWFRDGLRITSFDPAAWKGATYPDGGVVIDVDRLPLDPPDQIFDRPPDAVDTTIWGVPGWEHTLRRSSLTTEEVPPWGKRHYFAPSATGIDTFCMGLSLRSLPTRLLFCS
jgi:hypothetical protein